MTISQKKFFLGRSKLDNYGIMIVIIRISVNFKMNLKINEV